MTVVIDGPAWSLRGLDPHGNRYPLKVETAVQRPVSLLLPGVSTASELVRYFAAVCRARRATPKSAAWTRRSAGNWCGAARSSWPGCRWWTGRTVGPGGGPTGADGVRPWFGDGLDVRGAVNIGKREALVLVAEVGILGNLRRAESDPGHGHVDDGAFRVRRHPAPTSVRELFAPLFAAAGRDRLSRAELEGLRSVGPQSTERPENPWLLDLFTATRKGMHEAGQWQPDDLPQAGDHADSRPGDGAAWRRYHLTWTEMVESAVVFSDALQTIRFWRASRKPSLARGAAAELLGQRVAAAVGRAGPPIGSADESADRSAEELQAWLAEQMPDMTVRASMDELPPGMTGGHPAPAERTVLDDGGKGPADRRKGAVARCPARG